jgi:hypothetical protein
VPHSGLWNSFQADALVLCQSQNTHVRRASYDPSAFSVFPHERESLALVACGNVELGTLRAIAILCPEGISQLFRKNGVERFFTEYRSLHEVENPAILNDCLFIAFRGIEKFNPVIEAFTILDHST